MPEAAFSMTLRGTLDGVETLLTVRGMTPAEFKANLEAIKGLLDAVQPQPPRASAPTQGQSEAPIKDWCSTHQVRMKRHENATGVWYSHYIDGAHCKGK